MHVTRRPCYSLLLSNKSQDDRGEIDLRYFDASGFCLVPYIPYAWQEQGDPLTIKTDTHRRRLNVLGFINRRNELDAYTFEEKVDILPNIENVLNMVGTE